MPDAYARRWRRQFSARRRHAACSNIAARRRQRHYAAPGAARVVVVVWDEVPDFTIAIFAAAAARVAAIACAI